jgi:hypothetical protein
MNTRLIARLKDQLVTRARDRAVLANEIAVEEHQRAPRGGVTYTHHLRTLTRADGSRFVGPVQARASPHTASAPGEAPARDTGGLEGRLRAGTTTTPAGARAPVNARVLEFGYTQHPGGVMMEPRPLGAIALAELRRRVA